MILSRQAFLLAAFFALSTTPALGKSYPPSFRDNCVQDRADRYDLGWSVPRQSRSPYRDQCIDTSLKRPAILLGESQSGIEFANFFLRGRYYKAFIPAGAVETVYFQIAEFEKILGLIQPAHTQLRFVLKSDRPALLTPQSGGGGQIEIRDFVFSADYMAPAGVPYDAVRGLREVFMNAGRFVSTEDRVDLQVGVNRNTVRQFELDLGAAEKNAVLTSAIRLSDERGITDVYSTLSMNCTTEAFRLLFMGRGLEVPKRPWSPGNPLNPVTKSSIAQLKKMKLISDASETATLNREFPRPAEKSN